MDKKLYIVSFHYYGTKLSEVYMPITDYVDVMANSSSEAEQIVKEAFQKNWPEDYYNREHYPFTEQSEISIFAIKCASNI